jgi:hypothetical protein
MDLVCQPFELLYEFLLGSCIFRLVFLGGRETL